VIIRRDLQEIVVPVPSALPKRKRLGNSLGDEDLILKQARFETRAA
jgi:hypothetical protein